MEMFCSRWILHEHHLRFSFIQFPSELLTNAVTVRYIQTKPTYRLSSLSTSISYEELKSISYLVLISILKESILIFRLMCKEMFQSRNHQRHSLLVISYFDFFHSTTVALTLIATTQLYMSTYYFCCVPREPLRLLFNHSIVFYIFIIYGKCL